MTSFKNQGNFVAFVVVVIVDDVIFIAFNFFSFPLLPLPFSLLEIKPLILFYSFKASWFLSVPISLPNKHKQKKPT